VAPALHSLIVRERRDAAYIMEFLFHKHFDLKKLRLEHCWLGEDTTGLLANIVDLCPNLEGLSLTDCQPLTSAGYDLIPRLKKLSELNLSMCQVIVCMLKYYRTVFVHSKAFRRTLEMHFVYLDKKEIIAFIKLLLIISLILHKTLFISCL
jgi:hypothetical protein